LSEGWRDRALDQLKLAMSQADQLGVPELIVDVGQAYVQALLAAGKLEDAASISGKLSTWSQFDWRAAWAQASVYRALGQAAYAEPYLDKAKELAGDRVLPGE
jgi:Flp pilus assembly protein TadD